jgi:hypothetical protein
MRSHWQSIRRPQEADREAADRLPKGEITALSIYDDQAETNS